MQDPDRVSADRPEGPSPGTSGTGKGAGHGNPSRSRSRRSRSSPEVELSDAFSAGGSDFDYESDAVSDNDLRSTVQSACSNKRVRRASLSPSFGSSPESYDKTKRKTKGHRSSRKRSASSGARSPSVESETFDRCDPNEEEKANSWSLSKSQNKYLEKHFTEFLKEDIIQSNVLKDSPVPNSEILTVPKLQEDMLNLLPFNLREPSSKLDENLARVGQRIRQISGLLGLFWQELEKARENPEDMLELNSLIQLVEKSFLLVGQAFVWNNFVRRVAFMSTLVKNFRKANSIVKDNGAILSKNRRRLFRSKFYRALHKKALESKKAREIRQSLTPNSRPRSF
ncbi:uncharacterized protein LOC141915206 [Tubulanus polymorphus]|uniref:uncharacterized protein LOC141915206 n=1 Tax=Tubulanus polymorphus TaxID=672921 RepID=UPI003DA5F490